MRVFLNDKWTFPEAAPWQLDNAADSFAASVERHRDLAAQIGDLLLATVLHERQLIFSGFLDLPSDQMLPYYVQQAQTSMGALATNLVWEWGLPYGGSTTRMKIRADDHSFTTTLETTYTVAE